jgi:PST family polysaccharide transporter
VAAAGEHGVGTRALRGMFWAYGSYVGGRALVLVSTAILARILTPADFGVVAIAVVFIGFLETMSDLGMTQALIVVAKDELFEKAETVWAVSVSLGAVVGLAVSALGPLAASFFHQPKLTLIMPILGVNTLLKALGTTHFVLAQKELDFRLRTGAELADVVTRGTAGIALALAGAGVWSLVLGYLVGTMAMNIVLWVRVRWWPKLKPKRAHLRGLFKFGGALTVVALLGAVLGYSDDLIVGRALGASDLGLYSIAYRLPELLIVNLSLVAGQVLFPAMATIDRSALPSAFLTALRYGLMVGLPLTAALVVLAEPVTLAFFGERWRDAAPAMQVMALWAMLSPINIMIGTAYKAMSRVDILVKIAVPQTAVLIPALLFFVHDGIVAVAACQAVVMTSFTLIAIGVATRMLDVTLRQIGEASRPAVIAAAGLAAVLVLIERSIAEPWLALVVGVVIGGAVYVGLLWLVAPDAMRELVARAFPRTAHTAS